MVGFTRLRRRIAVEVISTVDEVSASEWDALLGDQDLYSSHAWLRSLEQAHGPSEILVARVDGQVSGGLPLWLPDPDVPSGLFHLPSYFPEMPGRWSDPFLWGGARRSTRNTVPVAPGRDRRSVLDRLFQEALRLAMVRDMAGVVVPFLPADVAVRIGDEVPETLVLGHDAEAVIEVPPGGLAELQLRCSRHDRSKQRAELAAFARTGGRVEPVPVTIDVLEEAAPLIAQTRAKYGNTQGESWVRDQLVAQYRCGLLDNAVAFRCESGTALTAVTVCYIRGGSLFVRYFGADYARDRPPFDYFVCGYYEPIEYAAAHGLQQFVLSTSALDTKVRRGARLAPLVAVVVPARGQRPSVETVRAYNSSFVERFQERYRARPAALGPQWNLLP